MSDITKMIVEYEKKAAQLAKLSEEMVQLSVKMAQSVPKGASPAPTSASVPAAPSTTSSKKPAPKQKQSAKPEVVRMTDAEFLAMGKKLGKESNGKVAGGKFPKATLPLYMGKVLSLPDVAEMLGVPVIRSDDPTHTHIYLDFSEVENKDKGEEAKPEEAKPEEAKPEGAKPEEKEEAKEQIAE
jgi:hypothetical protein